MLSLKLDDKIINNGREFTRILGGFDENKPVILVSQIAELLNNQTKHITKRQLTKSNYL